MVLVDNNFKVFIVSVNAVAIPLIYLSTIGHLGLTRPFRHRFKKNYFVYLLLLVVGVCVFSLVVVLLHFHNLLYFVIG